MELALRRFGAHEAIVFVFESKETSCVQIKYKSIAVLPSSPNSVHCELFRVG